jgi:hypothetical protein
MKSREISGQCDWTELPRRGTGSGIKVNLDGVAQMRDMQEREA